MCTSAHYATHLRVTPAHQTDGDVDSASSRRNDAVMARSPRAWWDWLVIEQQLSPPEDSWVNARVCATCDTWLVQQSLVDTSAVRLNASGRERTDVIVLADDPDHAWAAWAAQRTPITVRCTCGAVTQLW
jgi:hypothetical protein